MKFSSHKVIVLFLSQQFWYSVVKRSVIALHSFGHEMLRLILAVDTCTKSEGNHHQSYSRKWEQISSLSGRKEIKRKVICRVQADSGNDNECFQFYCWCYCKTWTQSRIRRLAKFDNMIDLGISLNCLTDKHCSKI